MDVVKTFLSSHQPRCEFNTLMLIVSLCKLFYITHCAFGMPSDHVTHSWAYQNTSEVMLRDVGKLIRSRSPRHSFLWRTLLPKQAPDCQSKLLKISMFENCYLQVYRLMMVSRIQDTTKVSLTINTIYQRSDLTPPLLPLELTEVLLLVWLKLICFAGVGTRRPGIGGSIWLSIFWNFSSKKTVRRWDIPWNHQRSAKVWTRKKQWTHKEAQKRLQTMFEANKELGKAFN